MLSAVYRKLFASFFAISVMYVESFFSQVVKAWSFWDYGDFISSKGHPLKSWIFEVREGLRENSRMVVTISWTHGPILFSWIFHSPTLFFFFFFCGHTENHHLCLPSNNIRPKEASSLRRAEFSIVRHTGNSVAHHLARNARYISDIVVWKDAAPRRWTGEDPILH